jgi:hypothetical protein
VDAGLVDTLYRNVLGRTPDDAGLAYWTSVLEAPGFGQDGLLIAFAQSDENALSQAVIAGLQQVSEGFWDFV